MSTSASKLFRDGDAMSTSKLFGAFQSFNNLTKELELFDQGWKLCDQMLEKHEERVAEAQPQQEVFFEPMAARPPSLAPTSTAQQQVPGLGFIRTPSADILTESHAQMQQMLEQPELQPEQFEQPLEQPHAQPEQAVEQPQPEQVEVQPEQFEQPQPEQVEVQPEQFEQPQPEQVEEQSQQQGGGEEEKAIVKVELGTEAKQCSLAELKTMEVNRLLHDFRRRVQEAPVEVTRPDLKAWVAMKKENLGVAGKERKIGLIQGVQVGSLFFYRAELALLGIHMQPRAGIDYSPLPPLTETVAVSVVLMNSKVYRDDQDAGEVVEYCGQGGHPKVKGASYEDQKLVRGNLGLKNAYELNVPVRMIRGYSFHGRTLYSYDGLYKVKDCKFAPGVHGNRVYKFRMKRIKNQPPLRILSYYDMANMLALDISTGWRQKSSTLPCPVPKNRLLLSAPEQQQCGTPELPMDQQEQLPAMGMKTREQVQETYQPVTTEMQCFDQLEITLKEQAQQQKVNSDQRATAAKEQVQLQQIAPQQQQQLSPQHQQQLACDSAIYWSEFEARECGTCSTAVSSTTTEKPAPAMQMQELGAEPEQDRMEPLFPVPEQQCGTPGLPTDQQEQLPIVGMKTREQVQGELVETYQPETTVMPVASDQLEITVKEQVQQHQVGPAAAAKELVQLQQQQEQQVALQQEQQVAPQQQHQVAPQHQQQLAFDSAIYWSESEARELGTSSTAVSSTTTEEPSGRIQMQEFGALQELESTPRFRKRPYLALCDLQRRLRRRSL